MKSLHSWSSRESIVWRWSHARHHSDTIIVGLDREIGACGPFHCSALLLKIHQSSRTIFKLLSERAAPRARPDRRPTSPLSSRSQNSKGCFWRARIYVLIYAGGDRASADHAQHFAAHVHRLAQSLWRWLMLIYGMQQHAGLAEDVLDHRLNTRTVYLNSINRYLYWNMGYHIEHHMFPMVPYYNFGKLHELMKADCPPPTTG